MRVRSAAVMSPEVTGRVDERGAGADDTSVTTDVFVVAWAASIVVHRVAFSEVLASPIGAISASTAVLAALAPRSARRFAAALVASLAVSLTHMPHIPNHLVFESLVNLAMLVVLAPAVRRGGRPPERVTAIVRPALVALYAWATVHKLNTDFFDPAVSCASLFTSDVGDRLRVLPTPGPMLRSAPFLTIAIEGTLPVLLAVRRWRWAAIVIGGAFHLLLALHHISGVYSFSAAMLASYAAFLAPRWATPLADLAGRLPSLGRHGRVLLAGAGLLAAIALTRTGRGSRVEFVGLAALLVAGGVAWVVAASAARRHREVEGPSARPVGLPAALVLGLVLVNGALPYLAVKTQLTFSMFSNLRTETAANHLFLPTWRVGTLQEPVVQVREASHEEIDDLADPGAVVPLYELRRVLATIDEPVRFRYVDHRGTVHDVDEAAGIGLDDPALEEPGFLTGRLVRFRPFEPTGPMACRH